MRQLFVLIILCVFVGNCFAQNRKVDVQTALYVGKSITDYIGAKQFNSMQANDHSASAGSKSKELKICLGERCYYYNQSQVVYAVTVSGNAGAVNDMTRAKDKQFTDLYSMLTTSLGDPAKKERNPAGNTLATWNGMHTSITAVYNKEMKLISMIFADNGIPPQ